jgi:hypothetical protein
MNPATSLVAGASAAFVAKHDRAQSRSALSQSTPVRIDRLRAEDVRPSRIGGAPLAGAQAVDAYQRTAAIDAVAVLSRIDDHA